MLYVPYTIIKTLHEDNHSAMPNAPMRPHVPKRHPIRDAIRHWRERRTPDSPVAELKLLPGGPGDDVCQAEVRDRGTTPAGVARAC